MSAAWCAARVVLAHRRYATVMVLAALAMAALLAWSSKLVSIFPNGGLYLEPNLRVGAAVLVLSALLGLLLPLQVYAWRRAAGSLRGQGIGALGALLGLGSMSCCAPVLLPSVLVLLGVSGTSLLSLNLWLHRWTLAFMALAGVGMLVSLSMTSRQVARLCGCLPAPACPPEAGTRSGADSNTTQLIGGRSEQ
jgi:hypothetical protein